MFKEMYTGKVYREISDISLQMGYMEEMQKC